MMFQKDTVHTLPKWPTVRAHLPVILVVGSVFAVFFGLHLAATGVVVLAALHLGAGLVAVAAQQLRKSRHEPALTEPR